MCSTCSSSHSITQNIPERLFVRTKNEFRFLIVCSFLDLEMSQTLQHVLDPNFPVRTVKQPLDIFLERKSSVFDFCSKEMFIERDKIRHLWLFGRGIWTKIVTNFATNWNASVQVKRGRKIVHREKFCFVVFFEEERSASSTTTNRSVRPNSSTQQSQSVNENVRTSASQRSSTRQINENHSNDRKRNCDLAATKIQAAFRSYLVRKSLMKLAEKQKQLHSESNRRTKSNNVRFSWKFFTLEIDSIFFSFSATNFTKQSSSSSFRSQWAFFLLFFVVELNVFTFVSNVDRRRVFLRFWINELKLSQFSLRTNFRKRFSHETLKTTRPLIEVFRLILMKLRKISTKNSSFLRHRMRSDENRKRKRESGLTKVEF